MRSGRLWLVVLAAVAALVAWGLTQAAERDRAAPPPSGTRIRAERDRRSPALAALDRQANLLLPGGLAGVRARIRALRGHPIVINAWAAWCGPCREELPIFRSASRAWAGRLAFVGVDVRDDRGSAARLLRAIPVGYPSYEDPHGAIAQSYRLVGTPSTIFYDRAGVETHVHPGPYLQRGDLDADIARYALG
jgi:cytochrome c biogenesis protein CcmG, thiol:disulfide interchange protein DsbE